MEDKYNLADFLDDLHDVFFPIKHADEESQARWTALVHRKLGSFSSATLRQASDDLVSHRKARGFPSPAEMIDACDKAARFERMSKPQLAIDETPKRDDGCAAYIAGEKTYKMLMESRPDVALEAAKEGCGGVLKAFVIRKGRLPNSLDEKIAWFRGEEPRSIRAEYVKFIEAYEFCVRKEATTDPEPKKEKMMGSWIKLSNATQWGAFVRLGDSMIEREKERAAWILKGKPMVKV